MLDPGHGPPPARDLVAALRACVGSSAVFSARRRGAGRLEGFEPARGWVDGPGRRDVVVEEGARPPGSHLGAGHKTGLYLDQRDNRARVGALAAGP